jgi:hypothetical protein
LAKKGDRLPTAGSIFLEDPTTPSDFDSSDRKWIYFESEMTSYYKEKEGSVLNTRALAQERKLL